MIVPSIWWENAPLVIQEALQQRRPVICWNVGGMAEMVQDQVNGLHFRIGDPADLARVMSRAADDASLWSKLSAASTMTTISQSAQAHMELYQRLLAERTV